MNLYIQLRLNAYKMILMQAAMMCSIIIVGALLFKNAAFVYSSLLGMLICVVTNLIFAQKFFSVSGASSCQQIVKAFYRAEVRKIGISMLAFIFLFKWVSLNYFAFFSAYVLSHISFYVVAMLTTIQHSRNNVNPANLMEHVV